MHHLKKEISLLTGLGVILLLGGLSVGIYFLGFFDTSVQVPDQEILGQDIGGEMVNNIGALASTIVPQGLIVVITLLFAIGAASYRDFLVFARGVDRGGVAARFALVCFERYADKKKGK